MIAPARRGHLLIAAAVIAAGCGSAPEPAARQPSRPGKQSRAVTDSRPKLPAVKQADFASLEAALAEIEQIGASQEAGNGPQLLRIERWLDLQGEAIVPQLTALVEDDSAGLASRLTACRVLARRGSAGEAALLKATASEPKQLRLKAIESIGRIKPSSSQIVDRLVALLDEQDSATRRTAILALREIGPPAKRAAAGLESILGNDAEEESIRSAAKQALGAIDPRRDLRSLSDG